MYISGRENQSIFPQQSVGIVLSNKKKLCEYLQITFWPFYFRKAYRFWKLY